MPDEARNLHIPCSSRRGPLVVTDPGYFPFAFNSAAGGEIAAAIAAHNPVIARANTSHPGTSRRLAELVFESVRATGLHPPPCA